jgi:hypothetical protein
MNAVALEQRIATALGIVCRVHEIGRMAVVVPQASPAALFESSIRRELLNLAYSHGYTHIAVELDAPLAS